MFDFSDLNFLGWIAVMIRVAYILSVVLKSEWHFNYENRLIQIRDVDKYVYSETMEYVYMGIRFVVSTILMFTITGWFI